jgi:hypothetical protein
MSTILSTVFSTYVPAFSLPYSPALRAAVF